MSTDGKPITTKAAGTANGAKAVWWLRRLA
jgi:hypothetical protein